MKLKKIASLALAGIMAVSMLAGCKDASSTPTDPETPTTPVTGVAASINEELDKNKDLISFAEDTDIQNLLNTYFANNNVDPTEADSAATAVSYNSNNANALGTKVANYIKTALKLDENHEFSDSSFCMALNNGKNMSAANVYVLNGDKLSEAGALKLVGNYLDDVDLLEDDGNTNQKYYEYEGSVAMVNAKTKGETKNVWVVAVVINRTAEDR